METSKHTKNKLEAGIAAAQAGDASNALKLLRTACENNPDSELAWLWRAKVSPDMKEFEICLARALEINPHNARTRVWLREIREQASFRNKVSVKSEKWRCPLCAQSFTVKPLRCARCHSVLSLANPDDFFAEDHEVRRDLVGAAAEKLDDADVSSTSDLASRYRTLGLAHLNLKNYPEALRCLNAAAEMNPNDLDLKTAVEALQLRSNVPFDHLDLPDPKDRSTQELPVETTQNFARAVRAEVESPPEIEPAPELLRPPEEEKTIAKVMVVDDSPTIRKVLLTTLENHGFEVTLAANGMESLAKIHGALPDLIILDVSMPHLDGYRICKIIKDNDLTSHIPVIFLTGKTGFIDRVRGRVAGGVEYLAKPIRPEILLQVIARHLPRVGAPGNLQ